VRKIVTSEKKSKLLGGKKKVPKKRDFWEGSPLLGPRSGVGCLRFCRGACQKNKGKGQNRAGEASGGQQRQKKKGGVLRTERENGQKPRKRRVRRREKNIWSKGKGGKLPSLAEKKKNGEQRWEDSLERDVFTRKS